MVILIAGHARAQEFVRSQPAGRQGNLFAAVTRSLAAETGASARDLVKFRDREWSLLTVAQIGAATADTQTSLHNLHVCPTCEEAGISRLVVGRHPDLHKYLAAGIVEIGVETVLAHYLQNHGPIRKWYWRYIFSLPQSISLYQHTHSSIHNTGLSMTCDKSGANCY
jgi:hypothetical protein